MRNPPPAGSAPIDPSLLPSARDVERYERLGWYLTPKVLSDEQVDTLTAASDAFYQGRPDRTVPAELTRLSYWRPADGAVQRNNDYIHYESSAIGEILRQPIIGAIAAALAGVEVIRIFQATLLYKPAEAENATNIVPWHTDKYYWATCTSEKMLTAFIPFHDCGVENGTITMIDGSHRWQPGTHRPAEQDDQAREEALRQAADRNGAAIVKTPVVIPRGHMTFHHCRLQHGSGANTSGVPRRSISLHLQDGDNAYQHYRNSPDGKQVPYKHDDLVRRTPRGLPDYADPTWCPTIWEGPGSAGR